MYVYSNLHNIDIVCKYICFLACIFKIFKIPECVHNGVKNCTICVHEMNVCMHMYAHTYSLCTVCIFINKPRYYIPN